MNDLALGYDVCNIWFQHPTIQTEYRAQQDDGSCTTALDEKCIVALTQIASSEAVVAVRTVTPTDQANSSAAALPGVCTAIGNKIRTSFPEECSRYFKDLALWAARESQARQKDCVRIVGVADSHSSDDRLS